MGITGVTFEHIETQGNLTLAFSQNRENNS